MSVNTVIRQGIISKIDTDVTIVPIKGVPGEVHYNPGLCRDDNGQVWVSIRSCIITPDRPNTYNHPMHYQNYLNVGKLDDKTLKITGLKEIKPLKEYTGLQWGIEDVRLFWRSDGIHGIGVVLTPLKDGDYRANQAEILIDYEKGTYTMVQDFGRPFGHSEKNWSPPEKPARLFDFIYSPTQIVLDGQIIGPENDLFIHNGTPLLEYQDGYISLAHVVTGVKRLRTYVTVAVKWDKAGHAQEISQFFHFNIGWREKLQERIEFVSGLIWTDKENGELLAGIGVKDELVGFARLSTEMFRWYPYGDLNWYGWQYDHAPNESEIKN